MTTHTLAQAPPPSSPQPLPADIQGLLANWISIGLGFLIVACVVFMGWALVEISQAKEMGRDPKQGAERVLVIAVVLMLASSVGAVVSLIYTPV